jgi:cellulose biosynthesis protein BcsQ
MLKIAVINTKGGPGKTTTSIQLAESATASGMRVGLADLDIQANLTAYCRSRAGLPALDAASDDPAARPNLLKSVVGCIEGAATFQAAAIETPAGFLLQAHPRIASTLQEWPRDAGLRRNLPEEVAASGCDAFVIDTPGRQSFEVNLALRCSDVVVVPVLMAAWSVFEPLQILQQRMREENLNPRVYLLPSMVRLRSESDDMAFLRELESLGLPVLSPVAFDPALRSSVESGAPVRKNSNVRKTYIEIIAALREGVAA